MEMQRQPGEQGGDACAGGGGKTLQLLSRLQHQGLVVASDIRSNKLKELSKRSQQAGFHNLHTQHWDGKALPALFKGFFVFAGILQTGGLIPYLLGPGLCPGDEGLQFLRVGLDCVVRGDFKALFIKLEGILIFKGLLKGGSLVP